MTCLVQHKPPNGGVQRLAEAARPKASPLQAVVSRVVDVRQTAFD